MEKGKVLLVATPLKRKLIGEVLSKYGYEIVTKSNLASIVPEDYRAVIIEGSFLKNLSQEELENLLRFPAVLVVGKTEKKIEELLKSKALISSIDDKRSSLVLIPKKLELLFKGKKEESEKTKKEDKREEKTTSSVSKKLSFPYKLVLIGSSTGGPGLIEQIVKSLPENYPNPICVIQHMPAGFTKKFAERLNSLSKVEVLEAEDDMEVKPGRVIIAKSGYHLHFNRKLNKLVCKLVPNYKNLFFVPSVDETFYSALEHVEPKNIVAVLLTGIGDDGANGMVALKEAGAYTIAESEKSAAVYGMPKEAKERGGAVKVLDFDEILKEILNLGKLKK